MSAAACPACGGPLDPARGAMTSVGLACESCAAVEADGGRLVRRAPRPAGAARSPPPAAPPMTPEARVAAFGVFLLVATPCLWTGGRDALVAVGSSAPAEVECERLGAAPGGWVHATGCRIDFDDAVVGTVLVALPERVWVPLRPTSTPPGEPFVVLVESHDSDIVQGVVVGGAPRLLQGPSAEGMLVDLADLDDDVRREIEEMPGRVSGTRVLRSGETPPGWLWIGIRLVLAAIVVLFGLAVALDRQAPPAKSAPAGLPPAA